MLSGFVLKSLSLVIVSTKKKRQMEDAILLRHKVFWYATASFDVKLNRERNW